MSCAVDFYDPINKKFCTIPLEEDKEAKTLMQILKHFGMQDIVKLKE